MSCEVFNETDFGMIEGCQQTFSVNLYNILGEEYQNVAGAIYLDVPAGCCMQISVKNTSNQAIDIQNSNIIVERIA